MPIKGRESPSLQTLGASYFARDRRPLEPQRDSSSWNSTYQLPWRLRFYVPCFVAPYSCEITKRPTVGVPWSKTPRAFSGTRRVVLGLKLRRRSSSEL